MVEGFDAAAVLNRCSGAAVICDGTLTLSSDCQDVPLYQQYCARWKQDYGCSDVKRIGWYVSINSLCRKTCGLCGNVNMMEGHSVSHKTCPRHFYFE